jgi:quercetin dioxygenase-like cupin family protein
MNKIFLVVISLLASGLCLAKSEDLMQITNVETTSAIPGPPANFTGTVKVKPLSGVHDPSRLSAGSVTFEPGARSAWHTHPLGQLILVTDGAGFVQQWGKPAQQIRPGDAIWTPPGVKHWHGASASGKLTHTAIQETVNGKNVEWLEKVSDDQYKSATQK